MAPSTPNAQLIVGDSVDYNKWLIGSIDMIGAVVTSRRGIAVYGGLDDGGYEAVETSPTVREAPRREVPVAPSARRRMIRLED